MKGLHLGAHPSATPPPGGGSGSSRVTFYVLDDVLYLTDPVTGYVYEAPVTFVGPTTLPSGLITAEADTLFFHYSGGTWSSPATQSAGTAPVGGSIVNDTFYVTIASVTYSLPVTPTSEIPGVPVGTEMSLVTVDDVEYLRIVLPDGEVRYEQTHETPTPDAEGGGGDVATDTIWDAAGDLAVGSGADTAVKLPLGTALQVLRVNVAGTNLEWAAAAAGGVAVGDSPTWTGKHIFGVAGAADAPAVSLTGVPFVGGTATTTKPHLLLEPSGTTSTGWSTLGTMLGVNAASGFAGNLIDAQVNGVPVFRARYLGALYSSVLEIGHGTDTWARATLSTQNAQPGLLHIGTVAGIGQGVAAGQTGSTIGFFLPDNGIVRWNAGSLPGYDGGPVLKRSAADVLLLGNADPPTGFNRLQLGGTTASFPAIKRSGAAIHFRLADDTGYCDITASQCVAMNAVVAPQFWENTGESFYAHSAIGGVQTKATGYFGWSSNATAYGSVQAAIRSGSGTPEGVVVANVGSLFLRTDGGASTTLYVKQSGTGNTGWVAK